MALMEITLMFIRGKGNLISIFMISSVILIGIVDYLIKSIIKLLFIQIFTLFHPFNYKKKQLVKKF